MKPAAERVAESKRRLLDAGGLIVTARLKPDAARALKALAEHTRDSHTGVIAAALLLAAEPLNLGD